MSDDLKHLDNRTVARYIARGALTEKDLEKHLKSLPDRAANVDPITTEMVETTPAKAEH